eukprot:scaffold8882_cov60-Phaeocystis_antarctica.AAC.2
MARVARVRMFTAAAQAQGGVGLGVSGSGGWHLRVLPPPGCRGTTTVGVAARATHGAFIKALNSAGEAWAGPGLAVFFARLWVCWGAATAGVRLARRARRERTPGGRAEAWAEGFLRAPLGCAGVRPRCRRAARATGEKVGHGRSRCAAQVGVGVGLGLGRELGLGLRGRRSKGRCTFARRRWCRGAVRECVQLGRASERLTKGTLRMSCTAQAATGRAAGAGLGVRGRRAAAGG